MGRVLAFTIALMMAVDANADESLFRYRLIADSTTPVPGGTGTFQGFGEPSIEGDTLAFIGVPPVVPNRHGIYVGNANGLRLVVDGDTPVPNGIANFHHYGSVVSLDGQDVAFWAQHPGPLQGSIQGVYAMRNGSLGVVADGSTAFPGSDGNIAGFDIVDVSLDRGRVAFVASDESNHHGLLVADGASTQMIVDTLTPMPNGSGLLFNAGFKGVSLEGERVAFWSAHGGPEVNGVPYFKSGIFLYDGSTLTTIADTSTILPGASTPAECFGNATSVSNGRIVFTADNRPNCVSVPIEETLSGAYLWDNGNIVRLADTTTAVPGSTETFAAIGALAIDGENVALYGTWGTRPAFNSGVYLWRSGVLEKVVDSQDTFQGRAMSFSVGSEALSGNSLAFTVRFDDDNTGAIYVATLVPEPSSLLIAAVGIAFLTVKLRQTLREK